MELLAGAQQFPGEYNSISFAGTFASKVREAWATGKPFGGGFNDQAGAFPLPAENPVETRDQTWQQWLLHAENEAKNRGFPAGIVASPIGAMGAMADIDHEPSDRGSKERGNFAA